MKAYISKATRSSASVGSWARVPSNESATCRRAPGCVEKTTWRASIDAALQVIWHSVFSAQYVGWVERSDTHHRTRSRPSYRYIAPVSNASSGVPWKLPFMNAHGSYRSEDRKPMYAYDLVTLTDVSSRR